jgi:nitroimidazol reductase NimA-like FMN-containing flavoprotein (pyridoxamine 5'-phosphate oxidase superfamily)
MRRSDREVRDFSEIADILRRADIIRLGLHNEPYPYCERDGVICDLRKEGL